MYSRRINDGAIAYQTRYELGYVDACFFGRGSSIRKRLRAQGIRADSMQRAAQEGDQAHLFDFDYKITAPNDRWAFIRGVVHASYIRLFCEGPRADEIVAKVNAALHPWLRSKQEIVRRERIHERREAIAKKRVRDRFKKANAKKRRTAEKEQQQLKLRVVARQERRKRQPQQPKRAFVPAAVSLKKNEVITPIFRRTTISWHEATCAIVAIYGIKPTARTPAREIVHDYMRESLRRNGGAFVTIKRDDFKFRFDLRAEFRGDFTPLTMSCTKDRHHPLYRAIRDYFYERIIGLPLVQQRVRRDRMFPTTTALAA